MTFLKLPTYLTFPLSKVVLISLPFLNENSKCMHSDLTGSFLQHLGDAVLFPFGLLVSDGKSSVIWHLSTPSPYESHHSPVSNDFFFASNFIKINCDMSRNGFSASILLGFHLTSQNCRFMTFVKFPAIIYQSNISCLSLPSRVLRTWMSKDLSSLGFPRAPLPLF